MLKWNGCAKMTPVLAEPKRYCSVFHSGTVRSYRFGVRKRRANVKQRCDRLKAGSLTQQKSAIYSRLTWEKDDLFYGCIG